MVDVISVDAYPFLAFSDSQNLPVSSENQEASLSRGFPISR